MVRGVDSGAMVGVCCGLYAPRSSCENVGECVMPVPIRTMSLAFTIAPALKHLVMCTRELAGKEGRWT